MDCVLKKNCRNLSRFFRQSSVPGALNLKCKFKDKSFEILQKKIVYKVYGPLYSMALKLESQCKMKHSASYNPKLKLSWRKMHFKKI